MRLVWAVIWGAAKRMGGGKSTRERALPKFLDPSKRASGLLCRGFLYRKNRALTLEGGGVQNVPYRGGVPKPLFGKGVIREVFHPLFFFHPPHFLLFFWVFFRDFGGGPFWEVFSRGNSGSGGGQKTKRMHENRSVYDQRWKLWCWAGRVPTCVVKWPFSAKMAPQNCTQKRAKSACFGYP